LASAVGWLYQLSEKLDDPINSERSNLPSAMTSYISALYFTCTSLTSVGFGNVSPNTNAEKVFSVAAMLIGGTPKRRLAFSAHGQLAFGALTLLVGWQEGHLVCEN